ncbi:hypothetical protein [Hydrogenovibrio halophilus]|uniref:hypothetical protein n=1 Tax=Hydrogenovibrio halophilus TaxID=373391 RepID=UPI0003765447|nr:hypothetical protein [Hydrogenovibrio halophilus]
MKTLTLQVNDEVSDKFLWLLTHFSPNEIAILDTEDGLDDDAFLRRDPQMVESLKQARNEPESNGVSLEELDW